MTRVFQPKIISANDLLTGDVVYLGADSQWTHRITDAIVATTEDEANALLLMAHQPASVIDPYLIDVALEQLGPRPVRLREAFRNRGPSVRPDLGRQADHPIPSSDRTEHIRGDH